MASRSRPHLSFFLALIFVSSSLLPLVFSADRCHPDDKAALLEIKKAMGDPYLLISYDPKVDCCKWLTVTCDPKTNRVTELAIFAGNVSGTISPSIAKLQTLTHLTLRKLTGLSGAIPPAICTLTRLTFLRLDWNQLSGPVPDCLSNLQQLTFLDLSFNQLSGPIPASLSLLPKLGALHLDRNRLTGKIPDSFGRFRGSVPDLYLNNNNLTGEIPASLGTMNFGTIDLSRNRLEGNASWLFGSWKKTQVLDISRNLYLNFDFSIVSFPKALTTLKIEHNEIFGVIPNGILDLPNLQVFNVSYNRLCGKIPQGPVTLKFDEYSYSHTNCLCGLPLSNTCYG